MSGVSPLAEILGRYEGRLVLEVEECVPILHRSRSCLYEDIRRGDLPHVRLGGRILVPLPGLLLWLGWPAESFALGLQGSEEPTDDAGLEVDI